MISLISFSLRGAVAQVRRPTSDLQIQAIAPEAMGENRMRFNGTVHNLGQSPAYTAAFFVTVLGIDGRSRIYDYNHASGVGIGSVINPGEQFEFRTWILGASIDFAGDFQTILNWTDEEAR